MSESRVSQLARLQKNDESVEQLGLLQACHGLLKRVYKRRLVAVEHTRQRSVAPTLADAPPLRDESESLLALHEPEQMAVLHAPLSNSKWLPRTCIIAECQLFLRPCWVGRDRRLVRCRESNDTKLRREWD